MRASSMSAFGVLLILSAICSITSHFITTRFPHSSISKSSMTMSGRSSYQSEPSTRRRGTITMQSDAPRKFSAKVIIAGAPASGKGTQCEMIKSEFGLVHLSTGDILRAAVQDGTPLGLKAKAFMDGGQLVPDELIIGVICDRLKEKDCEAEGWLLDGFPRTKSQADALSAAGMVPDCFVMLDVPEEILVERVTGRRTDPVTGKIYHMKFNPPTDPEVASRVVQRSDDTAEKIIVRYREFQGHIDAIKSCYEDKMVRVDGATASAVVSKCVLSAIQSSIDGIKKSTNSNILKVIIAGAPAAGKGTQCEMIKSEFGLVHLSTGDILRAAVQDGTPLGLKAKAFMDGGQLVPDELIIGVICDRLREKDCETQGWLLDGFPRTKSQADALSAAGMVPDCFVMLDVPEEILVERVTGRRTDPVTGKIYHMKFNPPTDAEVESRLIQRSDDTAEKIIVRYREFQGHIDAIKSCYKDKMVRVDGSTAQSAVSKCVADILDSAALRKLGIPVTITGEKAEEVSPAKIAILKSSKAATVLGLTSLILIDKVIAQHFKSKGWVFPSSLAGMVGIFAFLCGSDKVSPEFAKSLSDGLSPSVSFIKAWLPLFFVPPLVVLPLKTHLLKGVGLQLSAVIIIGAFLSLSTAGLFAKMMDTLFPQVESRESTVVTSAPVPSLPPLSIPAVATAALLIATTIATPSAAGLSAVLAAFGFTSTVTGYIAGTKLPTMAKKVAHPVLTCAAVTTSLLSLFGILNGMAPAAALTAYFGSGSMKGTGDIISSMLGPAILSFGVQLFQYRVMLLKNIVRVITTTLFSAGFGLTSSAVLARAFQLAPAQTALALMTRCITTPLALAGARLTGADPSLSAFVVVITGILGASLGESLLETIGVKEPVSVGLAVGAGAHGLGTAAMAHDPVKFASAVVSMTLTGLWTVALLSVTPIREKLVKMTLL